MPDDARGPDEEGLEALLRSLDHDLQRVTAEDVIARARRPRARWGQMAAGIAALFAVGGVAYALPGSPVRPWVDAALERVTGGAPAPTPARGGATDPGGIALDPANPLEVLFTPPLRGHVRITLTDGGELVARSAPGSARFTSEPHRLLVGMAAPDTFELRIPTTARRVEVLAGERSLFRVEGGEVSTAARPGDDGAYVLPLDPASP